MQKIILDVGMVLIGVLIVVATFFVGVASSEFVCRQLIFY